MNSTPIISGFYPDPSICVAGDTYYIANSSFEYSPGVPVWRSDDLTTWTQVGNALDRPEQLPANPGAANTGCYAPTLRFHDGRFWLVTTNFNEIHRGHLIVSAEDPAGPWSDPIYTTGTVGIDPDLCWDDDGTCHLTWASFLPPLQGIASVPINPATGEILGQPVLLWEGSGLAAPEGPHLYRIDGWWYLLLAEGGTERGHSVTMARARTLEGPWEPAPRNPIFTHRSTEHPVQNTGHADLVQCPDGTWAMVYLGVRPRGQTPMFHTNGRESFLAGVEWVDGWPQVREDRFTVPANDTAFVETFAGSTLHPRWVAPGANPVRFPRDEANRPVIAADGQAAPSMLAVRVRDEEWTAEARITVTGGMARFAVRIDDKHWYGLTVGPDAIEASLRIGPARHSSGLIATTPAAPVRLRIRAHVPPTPPRRPAPLEPDLVELSVVLPDGRVEVLGEFDGRYISTEVAGGFTGRVLAIEVLDGATTVLDFAYAPGGPEELRGVGRPTELEEAL